MMFRRDQGQDDNPSVPEYQTDYSSGQTYVYVRSTKPGDLPLSPQSTATDYTKTETETQFVGPRPTYLIPIGQFAPSITPVPSLVPSNNNNGDGGDGPFDGMRYGAKAVAILMSLVGALAIVLASVWFCCGGKAKWARRKAARRQQQQEQQEQGAVVLPLHIISSQQQAGSREPAQFVGDLPPPSYEEVVPVQHQRLAGGLPTRNDEEDGMVVDGKTPLSEIPFEDVVLDHSPSGSSSSANSANQSFSARHHNQYGDTNGHTNS